MTQGPYWPQGGGDQKPQVDVGRVADAGKVPFEFPQGTLPRAHYLMPHNAGAGRYARAMS